MDSPNTIAAMNILIVDDFATMRRIIKGLLREMGCSNVEEAEDGAVALRMVRNFSPPFDMVVCDINMPNMNGFEFLTAVKSDDQLKHIPVLMVTAEARKEDIIRAAQSGAAGYIVKPFTRQTLEEKLANIAARLSAAKEAKAA